MENLEKKIPLSQRQRRLSYPVRSIRAMSREDYDAYKNKLSLFIELFRENFLGVGKFYNKLTIYE